MPATAGRVRMPANNRVHSSAALQTHGIWQSAIGYDPYAPSQANPKQPVDQSDPKASNSEPEGENAYTSFQGLLALARLTGSNADEARGACKKCGRVGHLTFQCRNFLSVKEDIALQTIAASIDRSKGDGKERKTLSEDSEESEEESESSDSDADSEIEKIIAARSGNGSVKSKKERGSKRDTNGKDDHSSRRRRRSKKKKRSLRKESDGSDDSEDSDRWRRRKKRSRGGYSDEDDDGTRQRKSRKEKKRRSHRYDDSESGSEESGGHRGRSYSKDKRANRRGKREVSPSDAGQTGSDDSGRGRSKKRSDKRSSKRHRREEMH